MNAKHAKFSPQLHDPDRENVTRNVPDPPSPRNPNSLQPVTEIQQVMNMMNEHRQQTLSMLAEQNKVVAEQNRMTCSNWIIIANDIAHNKALFIDHKTKTDQTLNDIKKAIQDLTVRITRFEAEAANSIQPQTQNSTTQPKDTKVPKMCYHCDQITAQGLTDVIGKPLIRESHFRQKNQKFAKFSHPENCAQFMSLSVGNRAKVLSAQGFCIACAGKHGAETVCSMHWIGAKRPKSIRCCYIDRNSNEQCNYHISLCKEHLDFNIKELTDLTKRLGLPRYPVNHHKLDLNVDNSHLEPSDVLHTQSSAPLSTRDLDPDHGRALVDPEEVTIPTNVPPQGTPSDAGNQSKDQLNQVSGELDGDYGVAEPEDGTKNDPDLADNKDILVDSIQYKESGQ